MAYIKTDEDTEVTHIAIDNNTLCGLPAGYTRTGDKPVKEKWSCTCESCHYELEELRTIRKYE